MKNKILGTNVISYLLFLLIFTSFQVFSADDNNPSGGGSGINDDLNCTESCEFEYSKCENRTGGSFICNFQAIKCLAKCVVAKKNTESNSAIGSAIVTIQQKTNMRYLDAHEIKGKDYRLVTRPKQNNKTQKWKITSLGNNVFTLNQLSNGRYVDAHEYSKKDFGLVTRGEQKNNTQRWIVKQVGKNLFTIQQKSNGRYMDAHVTKERDYEVVTRTFQNNNTQRWVIKPVHSMNFKGIKQGLRSFKKNNYKDCDSGVCICTGDDDCDDLFSNECRDYSSGGSCAGSGASTVCICYPKATMRVK